MDDAAFRDKGLKVLLRVLLTYGEHFIFQLECGVGSKLLHYQGYLHVKKKTRLAQLAKLLHSHDLAGLHLSVSHDHTALKNYCMKKDLTYVAGPWDDRDGEGRTRYILDEKNLFPWQAEIVKQLRAEPDDRKVCWLVDQKGCSGKSSLAIFLCKHKIALPMSYVDAKDAMYIVTHTKRRDGYIFDLTRTKPAALSNSDLYCIMEQIKNGLLQTTKYQPEAGILRDPSHVWVFSNHVPDYKALTGDRWMVYEINANGTLVGFDRKRFVYESKKRALKKQLEDAREAKRRKLDADFVAKQLAEDPDGENDEAAVLGYLGDPPAPGPNAEL